MMKQKFFEKITVKKIARANLHPRVTVGLKSW